MLTKINLPSSYTYEGCTSLKEIIIPSVKSISNYTFQNCTSLINIKIPSSKIHEIKQTASMNYSMLLEDDEIEMNLNEANHFRLEMNLIDIIWSHFLNDD